VPRLVHENPHWGYLRVHGELLAPGVKVAASTGWDIAKDGGIGRRSQDPSAGRRLIRDRDGK
jgi:hypothetical protein